MRRNPPQLATARRLADKIPAAQNPNMKELLRRQVVQSLLDFTRAPRGRQLRLV